VPLGPMIAVILPRGMVRVMSSKIFLDPREKLKFLTLTIWLFELALLGI
jgi:hypothetical protein